MVTPRVTCFFILWVFTSTFCLIFMMNKSVGAETSVKSLLSKNQNTNSLESQEQRLHVDNVICEHNPKFTKNCTCNLNQLQKSYTSFCFVRKAVDNIIAYVQLYNGEKLFWVDIHINLCEYIKNKVGIRILDIAFPKLKEYATSDQDLTCPYYGRLNFHFPLTGALFENNFLPVGNYMANVTLTTSTKELIWNNKFYFIIL